MKFLLPILFSLSLLASETNTSVQWQTNVFVYKVCTNPACPLKYHMPDRKVIGTAVIDTVTRTTNGGAVTITTNVSTTSQLVTNVFPSNAH